MPQAARIADVYRNGKSSSIITLLVAVVVVTVVNGVVHMSDNLCEVLIIALHSEIEKE